MNAYTSALRIALLKCRAAEENTGLLPAARNLAINADAVSDVEITALRQTLKADGIEPAEISRYCGKGGLWAMGRANAGVVREHLTTGPLAEVKSAQLLYKGLRALLKAANDPESGSSGDALSDAESAILAQQAAKIEAAAKSVSKSILLLSASQVAAAVAEAAATKHNVSERLAFLDEVIDHLYSVGSQIRATVARIEQEATEA